VRRVLPIVVLAGALAGCASAAIWVTAQPALDEYPAARVRIYHAGRDCRIEVSTATSTIVTLPTRCMVVTHRVQP